MKIENNIVVYDDFKILDRLENCSLVEYVTIDGRNKIGIILNSANRIIFNINNRKYLNIELNKYNKMFQTGNLPDPIILKGEFKLNREYVINFPYAINFLSDSKIKITTFKKDTSYVGKALEKISKEKRTSFFVQKYTQKMINIDNNNIVFYEMTDGGKLNKFKKVDEFGEKKVELKKVTRRRANLHSSVLTYKLDEHQITDKTELLSLPISPFFKHEDRINNDGKSQATNKATFQDTTDMNDNKELLIINRGSLEPEKKLRSFLATSRNISIVKYLKNLYSDQCQICGEAIEISPGNFLSEVHHIKPLGEHNGADVMENMIVLCPNHHAMFDRGAITVDIDKKIVFHFNPDNPLNNKTIELKHEINRSYIAFHNKSIFINDSDHTQKEIIEVEVDTAIQTVDYGNTVTLQDMDTRELFDIRLEDKFNKDFMKPIEKTILQKCLNDIVRFDAFQYKIISIHVS